MQGGVAHFGSHGGLGAPLEPVSFSPTDQEKRRAWFRQCVSYSFFAHSGVRGEGIGKVGTGWLALIFGITM
jgi:hypothetical protein